MILLWSDSFPGASMKFYEISARLRTSLGSNQMAVLSGGLWALSLWGVEHAARLCFIRNEIEGDAIIAEALSGWTRAVFEDVALMPPAA